MYGQKFGRKLVKPLRIEKSRNGRKRNRSLTMLESWEGFTSSIQMTKSIQKLSKTQEENCKDLWHQPCSVRRWTNSIPSWWKRMQNRRLAIEKSSKQCIILWWNLMNPQDKVLNLPSLKTKKIALLGKDSPPSHITSCCISSSRCHKRWRFRCKGCRGQSIEKARENSSMGLEKSQEKKSRLFWKHKETKTESTLLHWWTCATSKTQRLNPICRSIKAEHCKGRFRSLRSLHWTRLICIADDCCRNHGRYCKSTRLWWTSSRCSICLFSGKIGRCSQIVQNSQIGMSRRLDTSSTTQRDKVMGKNWRSRDTSLAKFARSSISRIALWERQFEKKLHENGNVCSFIGNEGFFCP